MWLPMMVAMSMMPYSSVDRYRVYNGISMNAISLVATALSPKMPTLTSRLLVLTHVVTSDEWLIVPCMLLY